MSQPLYLGEDNLVRLDRLRLSSTGAYVNSGTVAYALKGPLGTTLSSGSLVYVASTHGRWQGSIDKADVASLVEGDICWLEITMSNGSGADGFRRIECESQHHQEEP